MKKILFLVLCCLAANASIAQTNYLLAQSNGVRATVNYSQIYKHFDANVTVHNYASKGARVYLCVDFEGDYYTGCENMTNKNEVYLSPGQSRTFRYWGSNDDQIVRYTVLQFNVVGGQPDYMDNTGAVYPYGYYNGAPLAYDITSAMLEVERQKERKQNADRRQFAKSLSDGKTLIQPTNGSKTVYYFMVTAQGQTGGCSNVFAVTQHTDGTWPFFSDIKQKIARETRLSIHDFYLIGYFETEMAAQSQQQNTLMQMEKMGFKILPYAAQSENHTPTQAQKATTTANDFWGNDAKKNATTPSDSTTAAKRSFWE